MTTTRRVGQVGFAITTVLVALITLTPQSGGSAHGAVAKALLDALHTIGVPASFGEVEWEFTANIIMFTPLGFFLALALPGARLWLGIIALPLMSGLIEASQFLFLPSRYPTVSDLAANSLGGWLGLLAGVGVLQIINHSTTRRGRAGAT